MTSVVIGETKSLFCHLINAWGPHHFLAVAAEITVAEIVGEDVN